MPAAASSVVAIHDVTIIDGNGGSPSEHMTVIVRGDRIHTIGKIAHVRIPDNADVVRGTGKFLIPGLCDMHVHLGEEECEARIFSEFLNGLSQSRPRE